MINELSTNNKIDRGILLARSKGYANISEMLVDYSPRDYKKMLAAFKPEKTKIVKKVESQKPAPPISGDVRSMDLCIDSRYVIYSDGRVWSKRRGKFVMSSAKGRKHIHLRVNGIDKTYTRCRLVFFHFGDHEAETIEDLGHIYRLDRDVLNDDISNLVERPAKGSEGTALKNRHPELDRVYIHSTAKLIQEQDISEVMDLWRSGMSKALIAIKFGTNLYRVNACIKRQLINTNQ